MSKKSTIIESEPSVVRTPQQIENLPVNLIKLDDSSLKKYDVLREGTQFMTGDLIHIHSNEYALLAPKSILTKEKITKSNLVLRKK